MADRESSALSSMQSLRGFLTVFWRGLMLTKRIRILCLLTLSALPVAFAHAQTSTLTLAWDPPLDTSNITGYHIYMRASGATYTSSFIDILGAKTTTASVPNVAPGQYFFTVRSYNGTTESAPSQETSALVVPVEFQGCSTDQYNGKRVLAQIFTNRTPLFSATTTSDTSGNVVIPTGSTGCPPIFDLRLKFEHFVARRLKNYRPFQTARIPLRGGDLDGNGVINALDYGAVKSKWGQRHSGPEDVHRDGVINELDFAIIKSNWFLADEE